jgi:hypothetical protein
LVKESLGAVTLIYQNLATAIGTFFPHNFERRASAIAAQTDFSRVKRIL